jgi:hypothetical protein
MTTTRLPLRIDPLPAEWWRGYVVRVANFYGVRPRALLALAPGATVLTRHRMTWSGTVATRRGGGSTRRSVPAGAERS